MSNSSAPTYPNVLRWLVRHFHRADPSAPAEEVIVSYSNDLPGGLSYAINTASRYEGTIYADVGAKDYEFFRSYAPRKEKSGGGTIPVAATVVT